jgi:hypothetical protein
MKSYLITFEPSANLQAVHNAVTTASGVSEWWHYLNSTYIVTTKDAISTLKNNLELNGLTGGSLLIIEVKRNSAGLLPKPAWDWINSRVEI